MFRKVTILLMSIALCWTTLACGGPSTTAPQPRQNASPASSTTTQLANGQYPVQQASFDDVNGEYALFLLNTPSGAPPVFRTTNLQMARLTDAEIAAGQKSYLKVEGNQPVLHLSEDFKIEYVHNVTETQTDPQTGQSETVVVRRETGFWAPFAGAVAGSAVGNLLFRPHYYYPPPYQSGVVLRGYGGYGQTYDQAASRYRERYQAPPAAVRNRTNFRTTGRLRTPTSTQPRTVRRTSPPSGNRSTGSGYGSSTLRQSGRSNPSRVNRGSGSFGSGSRSRSGFGSGGRMRSGRRR